MTLLTLPPAAHATEPQRAKALVFEDPRSRALLARIAEIAPSQATVLITGETGTGKEIVARHIHAQSSRARSAFAAVNCGAFAETLVESELFGHERGAFTGADRAKAGWFEVASGGTLFLDEVGELPPSVQVRLLRVLQEGEVVRLGARKPVRVDVRLIAATNVDLAHAVELGTFREDLYYRLHVASVRLPALRERPADILVLARHFVDEHARALGQAAPALGESAHEVLLSHAWPGNIRELENVLHNAVLRARGGSIEREHLELAPRRVRASEPPPAAPVSLLPAPRELDPELALAGALRALFEQEPDQLFDRIEHLVYRTAYEFCGRNQLQTARLLGISRNIVRSRLAYHGHLPLAPRDATRALGQPPRTRCVMRIGYQRFGILPLVKADASFDAELRKRGVEVCWMPHASGAELMRALEAGELDIGVVGECPPLYAQAADVPLVYVAAEAPAPDAEAIIVRADSAVRAIADLRHKRLGLCREANVHYMALRALEEAGLEAREVELVFLAPDDAHAAFVSGAIDAWAIWDPLLAAVQAALPTRVLRDGHGLTDNVAYYVADRTFADAQPRLVHALIEHVRRAGDVAHLRTGPSAQLLAGELGLPPAGMRLALERHRGTGPVTSQHLDAQQRIADALHRMQLIPRRVSVAAARWQPRLTG